MHNIDTSVLHTRVRVYAYCMNARSTHHGCMHIYVCILASMHTTREYSRVDVESTTLRAPINAILYIYYDS